MLRREYPILEFDEDKNAFIKPHNGIEGENVAERCALCFFGEEINSLLSGYPHKIVTHFIAG